MSSHIMVIDSAFGVGNNTDFTLHLTSSINPMQIELLSANIPTDSNDTTGGYYTVSIPEFGINLKSSVGIPIGSFVIPNTATLGSRALYNNATQFKQVCTNVSGNHTSHLTVRIHNADGSIATDMGVLQLYVRLTET
jgi:hypothetical protein